MNNICIIGAGNIGSRHLQALKNVKLPLSVYIIDPSLDSLNLAKERYESFPNSINSKHKLTFYQKTEELPRKIDLAIIATGSNVRKIVCEKLLNHASVKFMILEKLLFQKKEDYIFIQKLLKNKKCRAFVNCSMRTMPFYYKLKKEIRNLPFNYFVTGSQYGLITNAIHYIDHMAFLAGSTAFTIDTNHLDSTPIESKRKGFLELNGILNVTFENGSFGSFTCFPNGNAPTVVEITSSTLRYISKESEKKAYVSQISKKWIWEEVDADILYQSQMTNTIVKQLLSKGTCQLVSFDESLKIHLTFLESLLKFLNKQSFSANKHSKKRLSIYPFT